VSIIVNKIILSLFVSTISFFVAPAYAQSAPDSNTPDGLIKIIVADVMISVKSDPEIQKGNIPRVVDLVEKKIVPHTDMRRTTQLAMGKNWSKASPEQQNQLIMEFKNLLIRTYSGALSQLRDQTVQYKPLRATPSDTDVIVRTVVVGKADPIPLDYRLEKTNDGWKVYDINIMGAWLIEAYRNQFANQISQNGVDGLIRFLQERNAMLAGKK
jgi:phospholipid transport system substrate-binding protein